MYRKKNSSGPENSSLSYDDILIRLDPIWLAEPHPSRNVRFCAHVDNFASRPMSRFASEVVVATVGTAEETA